MEKTTEPTLGTPGEKSEIAELAVILQRIDDKLEKVLNEKSLKKNRRNVKVMCAQLGWCNLWLFLLAIGLALPALWAMFKLLGR